MLISLYLTTTLPHQSQILADLQSEDNSKIIERVLVENKTKTDVF